MTRRDDARRDELCALSRRSIVTAFVFIKVNAARRSEEGVDEKKFSHFFINFQFS